MSSTLTVVSGICPKFRGDVTVTGELVVTGPASFL